MTSPDDVMPLEESRGRAQAAQDGQRRRRMTADGELKAQAYMVGNCAHCHNPRGFPSVSKPELATVLNFLPDATDGGIFEFPLEQYSPIRVARRQRRHPDARTSRRRCATIRSRRATAEPNRQREPDPRRAADRRDRPGRRSSIRADATPRTRAPTPTPIRASARLLRRPDERAHLRRRRPGAPHLPQRRHALRLLRRLTSRSRTCR